LAFHVSTRGYTSSSLMFGHIRQEFDVFVHI
jgi:hypothetical protein